MKRSVLGWQGRAMSAALLAVSLWLPVAAVAADSVVLRVDAFHEVAVPGKAAKQRQPLQRAMPGQEIIYVVTYRNTGAKPAENVVINNSVPKGLVFQPGSAEGAGARAEVTVDGQKFGALEAISVKDSKGVVRPARASDVTSVRWVLNAAVKPNQEGSVSYKALLK